MKKIQFLPIVLLCTFLLSCGEKDKEPVVLLDNVSGYVQKGPYLNGTPITITELSKDLTPTGKNFTSQILDNKGTFEVKNIQLSSKFVELKADGFYFNEIKNESSTAQLTLFALSDLTDKSTLNVNVLSSLEKSRVAYLISNGRTFSEAKKQAQAEILKIFEIEESGLKESENMDISKAGKDNAILLAVSAILQGYLSVAALSELLANISTDIREDGILNSKSLGETLINNAKALKTAEIRSNLVKRYENLGLTVTIPDFEKYITQFIANTDFEFTGLIKYPENGLHGTNLLFTAKTVYTPGDHSLFAILPEGSTVKVKIQGKNWFYPVTQDWSGWNQSDWNDADNSRTFTSKKAGEIDLIIRLNADTTKTKTKIYIYENGAIEPSFTKEISVK